MRAAPPAVEVALGTGRRERLLVSAFAASAGGVLFAWLAAHRGLPVALGALAGVLSGATMGAFMIKPLRGRLRWDGAGWSHLPPSGAAVPLRMLELQMDLGGWLLLRVRPAAGRAAWAGLGRAQAGPAWHGLRIALYHHGETAADGVPR